MYEGSSPKHLTSTGDIAVGPAMLHGAILTPAAAVATAVIREGGSGGTIVMSLQAAANGSSVVIEPHMPIRDPHLTLGGAGGLFTALL